MRFSFSRVPPPSHLQQGRRTKRAFPRNPWTADRNASESAPGRPASRPKGRFGRHFGHHHLAVARLSWHDVPSDRGLPSPEDRNELMPTAFAPRVYGLDAICAAAATLAGHEEAAQFARRLYQHVADKDLAAAPVKQRAAAAASLLAFARRRLPGVAKVRVFNPSRAAHGFESRHTVVQIVNDDMPFLVDSIANEFNRRELSVHMLAHPVMAVRRDLDGDLVEVATEAGERARPESMMHIEIDRQAEASQLDDLAAALGRVLGEVRLAVEDWPALRQACIDALEDLAAGRGPELAEQEEFLRWLEANHFTFLGHRRYRYAADPAQPGGIRYELVPGSAL